jgi:hypothetical protein
MPIYFDVVNIKIFDNLKKKNKSNKIGKAETKNLL